MQLVADRFAVFDDCRTIDLATGEHVTLIVTTAGGPSEQTRWAVRCDALQRLQHGSMAPLVDYGAWGESRRFEAWRCGPSWTGSRAEAQRACAAATRFLRACGLTPGREAASARQGSCCGAVMLPDDAAGFPASEAADADVASMESCGLATVDLHPLTSLMELFQFTGGSRPQIVGLFGPPGSGKTTLIRAIARTARLNGFVPVSARLVSQLELPRPRSLCLLDDDSSGAGWSALLAASRLWPRAHVVIFTGREEASGVHSVALDRWSPEVLMGAVRPQALPAGLVQRIRDAASRAQGLPGRFAQALWPDRSGECRGHRRDAPLPRVAEQSADYSIGDAAEGQALGAASSPLWPSPGELASLGRRLTLAIELVDAGRHAPGIRQLRGTIGALARRHDWARARDGALRLGEALLRRGQPREAQAVLDEAREYGDRSGEQAPLIDITTMSGHAWTDLGRLDEAETSSSCALAAARAANDHARAASASRALARCLFWRGRYGDAEIALKQPGGVPLPLPLLLALTRLAARIAVGRRDLTAAMAHVTEALGRAGTSGDAREQAAAACTAAFVHLAVGDLDAVTRDTGVSLAAARVARDRLHAIDARLMLVEADRRRDRGSSVDAVVGRFRKRPMLPPLLRARCNLIHDLRSSSSPSEVLARHVAATGLGALSLWLPAGEVSPSRAGPVDLLTAEIVAILGVCQTAEDETRVLTEVCERLRRHLHAAGVAWVVMRQSAPNTLASAGARIDPGITGRAVSAGVVIAPHRGDDGIEAAAPVHYAGSIIGALAVRWTIGSTHDLSRAAAVLSMASAASAPLVSAALARRAAGAAPVVGGLLGIAPSMVELRRAVERAALAPFAVLIDGESGSGKELVARAVHRSGPRRDRPFCTLNCAALPDDLIEAELFGHSRGAFTGAVTDRAGVFEEAHGGTLFLDEIGELSLRAQAKVLRVIQEGELRRVGENVSRRIDVRIVAATNRDLATEASAGRFRLDLVYRLDVIRITVPPLRDRREDIPLLVDHCWREAASRVDSRATLAGATVAALTRHDWPGNVRELQNVLAALSVRCPKRGVIPPAALPPQFTGRSATEPLRLDEARRTFEERFVRAALVRTGGHRGRASIELGLSRQGLTKLIARLGISDDIHSFEG